MIKRTQQNKYFVALKPINTHIKIRYLLKMFCFLRVLRYFYVLVSWTMRMFLYYRHFFHYVRV
nr:MAG TPA: hypothetical protein [Caudoviricetes sp.]